MPTFTKANRIRPVALCICRQHDKILVFETNNHLYRPLGGGIEPGETSAEAVVREIREEIGAELTDLALLGVIESLFVVDGEQGHEIVFVYDGRLIDASLYSRNELWVNESDGMVHSAFWRELTWFNDEQRLVPTELTNLLTGPRR